MLVRTVSGACYVLIVAAFFLLREYVDSLLFNLFIWFLCGTGTFEIARALKSYVKKSTYILTLVYGVVFVPVYTMLDVFVLSGKGWIFALLFVFLMMTVELFIDAVSSSLTLKKIGASLLGYVYPATLLLCMLVLNGTGEKGFLPLLLIFVIAPCSDTTAYLVGMTYNKIRKGHAKKLCPSLSPNKTVAGAIGGLLGGAAGAIITYFIFLPQCNFFSPIFLFATVGVVASFLTEVGDLFESFIKRKVGIKDMGKIMPGHGGVMDRIDGMIFTSPFIMLVFLLV